MNYIIIVILDDALKHVTFHGGGWHVAIEFAVEEVKSYTGPIYYRALMAQNRSLLGATNVSEGQRPNAAGGGPQQAAGANMDSSKPL